MSAQDLRLRVEVFAEHSKVCDSASESADLLDSRLDIVLSYGNSILEVGDCSFTVQISFSLELVISLLLRHQI